jgi:biotin carboxyl carrier protein
MIEVTVGDDKKLSIASIKNEIYVNDQYVDFEIKRITNRKFKIFKNDRIHNAEVIEQNGKDLILKIDGQTLNVKVTDHIDQILAKLGMDVVVSTIVKEIKAPMPGSILSIVVKEGAEVAKGDPLLILEAMKMENMIKSPGDGIIDKILVGEKESVEKNQVLISFA